jgi:hypothetical protein
MKNQFKILLLVVGTATPLRAQQAPDQAKQAQSRREMGERDIAKEDKVAKLFETIRADLNSHKLSRINHPDNLEQTVCTTAITGMLPKHPSIGEFAIYKTSRPESISTELNKIASFDALHPKNKTGYQRYSVAVWRTRDLQTGESIYWVGVQLFWSVPMEFFDYHFTDDISYHNDWKKSVAPECRGK